MPSLGARVFAIVGLGVGLLVAQPASGEGDSPSWRQFGGASRDFKVSSARLADAWPEGGPPLIWKRPLGDGFSGIVAEGGVLYTMVRGTSGDLIERETVIAIDAETGKTNWEHHYQAPLPEEMDAQWGPGPASTPLIVNGRLFAVGSTGRFHALDLEGGGVIWDHDLYTEFSMSRIGMTTNRGYSCSPIAYRDTVILPVGGAGQGIVAFNQKDGSVAWKNQDFELSPSSPILIEVDGQKQLVVFLGDVIAGLDPANGELYWRHPHPTNLELNILTPVWGEDQLLFVSSAYDSGSRVVKLRREGAETAVEELWFSKRMRVHFGTAIRLGDIVYGSSGDFGPAFLMSVDIKTGEVLSQQRGFSKAQLIHADGKFILVGEDGDLALATPSATGLDIVSQASIMKSRAWTAPTLLGDKLYVRDRQSILALDLAMHHPIETTAEENNQRQ